SSSMKNAFQLNPWVVAIFLAIIIGLIIFGGIKWIANAATAVVPFMAVFYILMAVIIIILNIEAVPALFALIFKSAFGMQAAFGGIVGAMMEIGVNRGDRKSRRLNSSHVSSSYDVFRLKKKTNKETL